MESIDLNEMSYIAMLFSNDLHLMHLHAEGEMFDEIHKICQELYEEAYEEADWFAERAIADSEDIDNFSNIKSFIDDSIWTPSEKKGYDIDTFTTELAEKGKKYIECLSSSESQSSGEKSIIDGYIAFWEKQITYKNESRLALTKINSDNQEDENQEENAEGDELYNYANQSELDSNSNNEVEQEESGESGESGEESEEADENREADESLTSPYHLIQHGNREE